MDGIYNSRVNYITKNTSPLKIKVNVYIDGNNLYVNLRKELKDILEIYKLAAETYELQRTLTEEPELLYQDYAYGGDLRQLNYEPSPEKMAKLGAHYILSGVSSSINNSIKKNNAKNLLGDLELDKENILFPHDVLLKSFFVNNISTIDLESRILPLGFSSNDEAIDLYRNVLKTIDEYKNLKFTSKKNFLNFLKNNEEVYKLCQKRLSEYGLKDIKGKIRLEFDYQFFMYRAKIDKKKFIDICKRKLSIENLSLTQKTFFKDNIEYLKENKFRPNIRGGVIDINLTNQYYETLENLLGANVSFGNTSWDTFKMSEKEVDSNIILDIQGAMIDSKADIFCLLTNDSDFAPLIKKSKELKKEFYLCSVVPKKTISNRLREELPSNKIFSIKRLGFTSMFQQIIGSEPSYELEQFIIDPKIRNKKINEIKAKILNQVEMLNQIQSSLKNLQNSIDFLFKERF